MARKDGPKMGKLKPQENSCGFILQGGFLTVSPAQRSTGSLRVQCLLSVAAGNLAGVQLRKEGG